MKTQELNSEISKLIKKHNLLNFENDNEKNERKELKKQIEKLRKELRKIKNSSAEIAEENEKLDILKKRLESLAFQSQKYDCKITKRKNGKNFEFSSFWLIKDLGENEGVNRFEKIFIGEYIDLNNSSNKNIIEDYFGKYY